MGLAGSCIAQTGEEAKEGFFHRDAGEICLDLASLTKLFPVPVEHFVGNLSATHVGLGHQAGENLKFRKLLGKPGAPFGGLGFFDPQAVTTEAALGFEPPPAELTAETIKATKLEEFRRCACGEPSMYFWALQPIFNVGDRVVAAETLVRARNGTDSAPFEDLMAIMDPNAHDDVKKVYSEWKATEIVDFTLKALKEHPVLQTLAFISTNLRPLDLDPESMIFAAVSSKLRVLSNEDRNLLLSHVLCEVTEDQEHPDEIVSHIQEWQKLGFRFVADDTIGTLAAQALGKEEPNFHTTQQLERIVGNFGIVKVDMSWAGHLLFLAHPSVATRPALRQEILSHARDEDEVYMAAGPSLRKLNIKHSALLEEFADWAKSMIAQGKKICIEMSVRQEDANCAFALAQLAEMGLDVCGEDSASFCFQGGPSGAKAFLPEHFASCATIFEE